jgi:photosystem II stability/assembly factor-like uncharacterized protein
LRTVLAAAVLGFAGIVGVFGALGVTAPLAAQTGVWTPLGPEGGIVDVLVFAPSDPQVVYAGTQGGGVYRSTDGGRSWSLASGGLGSFAVRSLAVDPRDPGVVYAGTGNGFWKTTSGGQVWVQFRRGLDPAAITTVAVDPSSPSRLYAGTPLGLYQSTNGGRRWALVHGGLPEPMNVRALTVDRAGTVLVGRGEPLGLFKSTDGGVTWSDKTAGLNAPRLTDFQLLAVDPSSPSVVYAVIEGGFFRSLDGGESFQPLATPPPFRVAALAVSPSGTVYAGTVDHGVFQSGHRGDRWSAVAAASPAAISPAFTATAVAPAEDGTLLAGSDGHGVLRLPAGARFWRSSSAGLRASVIRALALDPRAPSTLYAGLFGRGLEKSTDGGASWQESNDGLASPKNSLTVTSIALDPLHPGRVYAGVDGGGLATSADGGSHFVKVADFSDIAGLGLCNTPSRLAVDPSSGALFVGILNDFRLCPQFGLALRSTDAGRSFSGLEGLSSLAAIAFDPVQPFRVYAADGPSFFASGDDGRTFARVGTGVAEHDITDLAVDPNSPRRIFAGTFPGGVFRSGDRGRSWAPTGPLPDGLAKTFLLAEPGSGRLYAGVVGAGVFVSADGGGTWQPLGQGLPPGTFGGPLALDARHHILYAGTAGSGVYRLELGGRP